MHWIDEGAWIVLNRVVRKIGRRVVNYRQRWRAVNQPSRIPCVDSSGALCQWLSTEPPILLAAYWLNERYHTMHSLEPVFQQLRRHPAYFIYLWYWHLTDEERVRTLRRMEQTHRRRFPSHQFLHLCNSLQQFDAFRSQGLAATFCNHNCLVDETVYRPLPGVAKRFDAVYNARLKGYKRHELAARIDSLALIYAMQPAIDNPHAIAGIRCQLAHAYCYNHQDEAGYRALNGEEICRSLNECRVGLCLSAVEGGMFASMEYLLCGLPVISTASLGGRDVFFDEVNAQIVDATPEAVRAGVDAVIARAIAPETVRERTMVRVLAHRRTFQAAVQAIYDQENVARNFSDEWPHLFYDRLHRFQTHEQILRQLVEVQPPRGHYTDAAGRENYRPGPP